MTTLVVVRHGQASFAARNYDELSAVGERQALLLGEHWARCGQRFDAAYTGDMVRQQHTATHAFKALGAAVPELLVDPAFNEFDHQNLIRAYLPVVARENPDFAADRRALLADRKIFQRLFELITGAWLKGVPGAIPVGESWEAFRARCEDGFRRIAARGDERVVVFTSGGVIAVALLIALGIDADMAFRLNWRIHNASVHHFRLGRRGNTLLRFNDVAHLELIREDGLLTFR